MPDVEKDGFRELLWTKIAEVRDAAPRVPNDADTWDVVDAVVEVLHERLTSDEFASHIQNWVPLGYDYPIKDPYPNTYDAARAILAEVAESLSSTSDKGNDT